MESWTETSQHHLTDWAIFDWFLHGGLLAVALGICFAPVLIVAVLERLHPFLAVALGLVLGIGSICILIYVPGLMMRHMENQANVWWVAVPLLLLAGLLGWRALNDYDYGGSGWHWLRLAPALLITASVAFGLLNDWLHRIASTFPTSIVGLILAALVAVILLLNRDR